MVLPFLNKDKWPIIREDEDRVVNASYDSKLQESLVDEVFIAMEKSDHSKLREALMALVHSIQSEEHDEM